MSNDYFIKPGYRPNDEAITIDDVSGSVYWNRKRTRTYACFQYDVYRYAAELVAREQIDTVVDLGCGLGFKLDLIRKKRPEARIIGIDQPRAIEYCKRNNDFGEWYVDDFEHPSPDLPSIRAGLVMSSDVVEHLLEPDHLIRYLKARVAPGGLALLSTPERDLLHGSDCDHSPNPSHVREWNYDEFERYLQGHGAQIVAHFVQYPVRFGFHRAFYQQIVKRYLTGKPVKYSQVCLLRWSDSPVA